MTTAPPIIETRGLTKRFGSRAAVSDINLTVPAGCAFGFLGHNGAGKTTLIRMLVGLTRPSAGVIRIAGQSLADHREQVLARVGAIIEEPRFHPHLTGRENLQVIAAARGPQARRGSSRPWSGPGSATAAMTGRAPTPRACANGSASPAACWPTRGS